MLYYILISLLVLMAIIIIGQSIFIIISYDEPVVYDDRSIEDLDISISVTDSILDSIDRIIDLEIAHRLKEFVYNPNAEYNVMNIDIDIKEISTSVYNYINKDTLVRFDKSKSIYTSSFIMKYIINKTEILVMNYTKNLRKFKIG